MATGPVHAVFTSPERGTATRMEREGRQGEDQGEDPGERINRADRAPERAAVALPGAQVLLAFLLTVPFMQRFDELDAADRRIYMFAVIAAALGSLLLIAPSAHHACASANGRRRTSSARRTSAPSPAWALLALAVGAGVYLVADVVYGRPFSGIVSGVLIAVTVLLWFVMPLVFFRYDKKKHGRRRVPAPPSATAITSRAAARGRGAEERALSAGSAELGLSAAPTGLPRRLRLRRDLRGRGRADLPAAVDVRRPRVAARPSGRLRGR